MCAMNRAITYICMAASVMYIIKDHYSSNTLISLGKGTKSTIIVALPIHVPVADLPLTAGEVASILDCFAVGRWTSSFLLSLN